MINLDLYSHSQRCSKTGGEYAGFWTKEFSVMVQKYCNTKKHI